MSNGKNILLHFIYNYLFSSSPNLQTNLGTDYLASCSGNNSPSLPYLSSCSTNKGKPLRYFPSSSMDKKTRPFS